MQSEKIGELAKALAKAQAAFKTVKKSRTAKIPTKAGGEYSYNYADWADIIEAVRKPLTEQTLALTQTLEPADGGGSILVTTLMHGESGEWKDSRYRLAEYDNPQAFGSAMAYGCRYSGSAILNIAAEDDDDGKGAQDAKPLPKREAREPWAEIVPPPADYGAVSSGDASAILDLAAELEQITGKSTTDIIKDASTFAGDDNRPKYFSDPTKVKSAKWLKSVREKLERELHTKGANAAVGDEPLPF